MDIEAKLMQIPIIRLLLRLLKHIKLPGFVGMSVYDLLRMYVIGIVKGALTSRAGSIAFSMFLALFPFALFVLTIIPFIPVDSFQTDFILLIKQGLPPKTSAAVDMVLIDIANNKYGGLLSFGFIVSIFLMTNGINALFNAFEYTYHSIKSRSILKQYLVALMVSFFLVFSLMLLAGVLVFSNYEIAHLHEMGIIENADFISSLIQMLIILVSLFFGISTLYYFGTIDGKKIGFFSPGAIMTSLLVLLNFKLFGIYVSKFSQYNELYGSIGTLIVLMLFIWLNSIILLLGYELNTSLICLKEKCNKDEYLNKNNQSS